MEPAHALRVLWPSPSHCVPHTSFLLCQVFYNLGDLDDALTYALGAGKLFNVNEASEYVQTILGARRRAGRRVCWVPKDVHACSRGRGHARARVGEQAWMCNLECASTGPRLQGHEVRVRGGVWSVQCLPCHVVGCA